METKGSLFCGTGSVWWLPFVMQLLVDVARCVRQSDRLRTLQEKDIISSEIRKIAKSAFRKFVLQVGAPHSAVCT